MSPEMNAANEYVETELDRFNSFLEPAMVIAEGYGNTPGALRSELRQEARLALAVASRRFDPGKDRNFFSFARTVIHNRLKDLYRKGALNRSRVPVSLDESTDGESGETRGAFLADERSRSPLQNVSQSEAREVLERVISELPERERNVVRSYWNCEIGPEIAKELGITKQAISKIRETAFARLRQKLLKNDIREVSAILSRPAASRGLPEKRPNDARPLNVLLENLEISDFLDEILPSLLESAL